MMGNLRKKVFVMLHVFVWIHLITCVNVGLLWSLKTHTHTRVYMQCCTMCCTNCTVVTVIYLTNGLKSFCIKVYKDCIKAMST